MTPRVSVRPALLRRECERAAQALRTWEGRSSFTEAFRLLGVKRMETFRRLNVCLGLAT